MARVPKALVIAPVIDAKTLLAELDKVLVGFAGSAQMSVSLRNTATTNRDGKNYPLFPFLDKGTAPHWIGEADDLMGDPGNKFGPVWGPIFHPGTRPYDITARVAAYFSNRLDQVLSSQRGPQGALAGELVQYTTFRRTVLQVLQDTLNFARSVTPVNWHRVRESYEIYLNGRKIGPG